MKRLCFALSFIFAPICVGADSHNAEVIVVMNFQDGRVSSVLLESRHPSGNIEWRVAEFKLQGLKQSTLAGLFYIVAEPEMALAFSVANQFEGLDLVILVAGETNSVIKPMLERSTSAIEFFADRSLAKKRARELTAEGRRALKVTEEDWQKAAAATFEEIPPESTSLVLPKHPIAVPLARLFLEAENGREAFLISANNQLTRRRTSSGEIVSQKIPHSSIAEAIQWMKGQGIGSSADCANVVTVLSLMGNKTSLGLIRTRNDRSIEGSAQAQFIAP